MENSIYIGLSRQVTLKNNMDVIANNVANINTPGYRAQNLLFHEFISDPKGEKEPMSFVYDEGQYSNTDPGAVQFTGNPLDVSVAGPGFISIIGPDGNIAYTRAGNFQLAADGKIVTPAGFPVASRGGAPITVPQGSTEIGIAADGTVSNQDGAIGQIGISEFANLQNLKPAGDNLYKTEDAPLPPANSTLKQAQLEGSNVKPVLEITRMIDTLRSFQSVQQVLQSENERLRTAIQRLTRQG
ncbi:MAG: flagellar basal-body rod protein FlgF [Alphaproteobacteria bacterium]|nr:flagellar basal-body rod protein FlgF [Alphaproteobacteria bacterium]